MSVETIIYDSTKHYYQEGRNGNTYTIADQSNAPLIQGSGLVGVTLRRTTEATTITTGLIGFQAFAPEGGLVDVQTHAVSTSSNTNNVTLTEAAASTGWAADDGYLPTATTGLYHRLIVRIPATSDAVYTLLQGALKVIDTDHSGASDVITEERMPYTRSLGVNGNYHYFAVMELTGTGNTGSQQWRINITDNSYRYAWSAPQIVPLVLAQRGDGTTLSSTLSFNMGMDYDSVGHDFDLTTDTNKSFAYLLNPNLYYRMWVAGITGTSFANLVFNARAIGLVNPYKEPADSRGSLAIVNR